VINSAETSHTDVSALLLMGATVGSADVETAYLAVLVLAFLAVAAGSIWLLVRLIGGSR
jgi:hypothetical protein